MAAVKRGRRNISEINTKKNKERFDKINNEVKNNDKIDLKIDLIFPPKYHDRKYIDKYSIIELSESIKYEGLIYPIIVRKLSDNSYERIIGYRRLEAYKILKRDTIPAIVLENISDEEALLFMTTENIQRENLSIYDETLALLDYLSVSLGIDQENTIKLLNRYKNFNAGSIELNYEERSNYNQIEEILKKTGKITINTLVNRLSMLNVHPLLKEELSKGSLSFSNAQILNKLKEENLLKIAIIYVLKESCSKRETLIYVNERLPKKHISNNSNLKKIAKIKLDKLDETSKDKINILVNKILEIVNNKDLQV